MYAIRTRAWILAAALLTVGAAARAAEQPTIRLEGDTVVVITDRYEAHLQYGALVHLHNRLTGATYTVSDSNLPERLKHLVHGLCTTAGLPAGSDELTAMHPWAGQYPRRERQIFASVHHPTARSKVDLVLLASLRTRVTWTGLACLADGNWYPDEKYSLDMAVLPESGDLEILASASGPRKGVFSNGFLMANFSRELRFIHAITNGSSGRPIEQEPSASGAHWPFPWHASLVIAEDPNGKGGSLGLWMADPHYRDRYLHVRNGQRAYDVSFESVNDTPFDKRNYAESSPIRINVYAGNWTQPAGAFRDWWAKTFHVKTLAQRDPNWLRRAAFVGWHHDLPTADMMPYGILLAPQSWKVCPDYGDLGLFPDDIAKGPEIAGAKASWPRIRREGGHMMVYLNINHMNTGHPDAEKFWDARLSDPFKPPAKEPHVFKLHDGGAFVVNAAYKPWQDLICWWAGQANKRYGIDGFYMDCSAGQPNSGGGLIDGRNDCDGQVALMRRMKAEIPGCWLGVEFVTEVNASVADTGFVGYDSWWPGSLPSREKSVHPILGFLFSPYVHLWYLSNPSPVFDEVMARLPLASGMREYGDAYVTDHCQTQTVQTFRARLLARTGMRNVWPDPWEPGVLAHYRDPNGGRYRTVSERTGELKMWQDSPAPRRLVYWYIHGRDRAALNAGTGIEGWFAYAGDEAIGLDPNASYLYTAEPREADWQVTHLPDDVSITGSRGYGQDVLVLQLAPRSGAKASGWLEVATSHEIVAAASAARGAKLERLPNEAGAAGRRRYRIRVEAPGAVAFSSQRFQQATLDADGNVPLGSLKLQNTAKYDDAGLRLPVPKTHVHQVGRGQILMLPPWQQHGAVDALLKLPAVAAGKRLVLRFGLRQNVPGNRAVFLARVNGQVLRQEAIRGSKASEPAQRWELDLTPWAGKDALVTLEARDAYLFDWIRVRQPELSAGD